MIFKTHDIAFAATLWLYHFRFTGVEDDPNSRSRKFFLFDIDDSFPQFEQKYLLGECLVEPNDFHNSIQRLTTIVKRGSL